MKLTLTNGLGTSTHKSATTEKKKYEKNRKNTEGPGKVMPVTVEVIQRNVRVEESGNKIQFMSARTSKEVKFCGKY